MQAEVDQLASQKTLLCEEIGESTQQREKLAAQLESLVSQQASLEASAGQLESQRATMQSEIDALAMERTQLSAAVGSLRVEGDALERKEQEIRKAIEVQQSRQAAMATSRLETERSLERLQGELSRLAGEIATAEQQRQHQDARAIETRQEVSSGDVARVEQQVAADLLELEKLTRAEEQVNHVTEREVPTPEPAREKDVDAPKATTASPWDRYFG